MRSLIKTCLCAIFLVLAAPLAALSAFGRFHAPFYFFAQACALVPGILGDYLRICYYRLTLTRCDLSSRIQFGSFFSHPQASIAGSVYIGSYCVLGRVEIGERTQISSGVMIPSGKRQHSRSADGSIESSNLDHFETVRVRKDGSLVDVSPIRDRWGSVVNEISEVSIKPKKTDIYVNLFGVAWKPYYIVQSGSETIELPAFGAE